MAKGVVTEVYRQKVCRSHAGDMSLPPIVKMGFGSGGTDTLGQVIEVSGIEVDLRQELLKKDIDSHKYPMATTCRYTVKLLKTELAGEKISELALYDNEGDMAAYKTFLPKGKDADMEFVFEMDVIF